MKSDISPRFRLPLETVSGRVTHRALLRYSLAMSLFSEAPRAAFGPKKIAGERLSFLITVALLSVCVALFLGRMLWFSWHNMLWADEFCSWNVISDDSFRHAFVAWRSGADSGGALFYLAGRMIAKVTGTHPEAIRVYSGLCFAGSAYLWFDYLRPKCGFISTIAGISAIYLGSPLIAYHSEELRFYGQFYFAFSWLLTYLLKESEKTQHSKVFLLNIFVLGSFLVLSHTIGAIYIALVVVCVCLTSSFAKDRLTIVAALALTWGWLAVFRSAVSSQSKISWIQPPSLADFARYYTKNPFAGKVSGCLFYVLLAGLLMSDQGTRTNLRLSYKKRSFSILAMTALALIPPFAAVAAHFTSPLTADRYLMPYLCFCTVALCFSLQKIGRTWRTRFPTTLGIFIYGLIVLGLFVSATASVPERPVRSLQVLANWPKSGSVILDDTNLLFQLQYYYPAQARHYFAAYPASFAHLSPRPGTMVLADSGYLQNVEPVDDVLCRNGRSYLLRSGQTDLHYASLPPGVALRAAGTVLVSGAPATFYEITYDPRLCHEVASLRLFEERF